MKHLLKTAILVTFTSFITSCGTDLSTEDRNMKSKAVDETFEFSFDLTSDDSAKLVEEKKETSCVEPAGVSRDAEHPIEKIDCEDLFDINEPKVLIKVTLQTKFKNKWTKKTCIEKNTTETLHQTTTIKRDSCTSVQKDQ